MNIQRFCLLVLAAVVLSAPADLALRKSLQEQDVGEEISATDRISDGVKFVGTAPDCRWTYNDCDSNNGCGEGWTCDKLMMGGNEYGTVDNEGYVCADNCQAENGNAQSRKEVCCLNRSRRGKRCNKPLGRDFAFNRADKDAEKFGKDNRDKKFAKMLCVKFRERGEKVSIKRIRGSWQQFITYYDTAKIQRTSTWSKERTSMDAQETEKAIDAAASVSYLDSTVSVTARRSMKEQLSQGVKTQEGQQETVEVDVKCPTTGVPVYQWVVSADTSNNNKFETKTQLYACRAPNSHLAPRCSPDECIDFEKGCTECASHVPLESVKAKLSGTWIPAGKDVLCPFENGMYLCSFFDGTYTKMVGLKYTGKMQGEAWVRVDGRYKTGDYTGRLQMAWQTPTGEGVDNTKYKYEIMDYKQALRNMKGKMSGTWIAGEFDVTCVFDGGMYICGAYNDDYTKMVAVKHDGEGNFVRVDGAYIKGIHDVDMRTWDSENTQKGVSEENYNLKITSWEN